MAQAMNLKGLIGGKYKMGIFICLFIFVGVKNFQYVRPRDRRFR